MNTMARNLLASSLRGLLSPGEHVTLDENDSKCVILMIRGRQLLFAETESAE